MQPLGILAAATEAGAEAPAFYKNRVHLLAFVARYGCQQIDTVWHHPVSFLRDFALELERLVRAENRPR